MKHTVIILFTYVSYIKMVTQEFEDNNNKDTIASITIKTSAKREVYGEYNVKQKFNETTEEYFKRFDEVANKFLNEVR